MIYDAEFKENLKIQRANYQRDLEEYQEQIMHLKE